ncbi:polyphosphate kinase 2 [Kribbella sp. NPDC048928]|uniref:polyphosphate kinase 2 n=1 Tax=Kribbella sp. NPDC048928 TaxID=3364111 RepID=UPI003712D9F3
MKKKVYESELLRLQAELVNLQEWVRVEKARVVVVFEGRDAAGKGSTIKRVTEYLNPRVARIAALPAPTERERSQWYLLVEDGVLLRKYWFSVSDGEQERRFRSRLEDPMRRWKLSPMDLESITRWEDYSRAKDEMFVHTDIPEAPWYVVESEDKRSARINMIAHLLSTIPYHEVQRLPLDLPPSKGYERPPREMYTQIPDRAAQLRD